nr:hypothetical protein [Thiorhodococcus mannitoliphagus]
MRVKNNRVVERVLERMDAEENLADLRVEEVFARCITAHGVSDDQRPGLLLAYQEILQALNEADPQAD